MQHLCCFAVHTAGPDYVKMQRRARDKAREAARAKEAAAEAELREAHAQAAELRSKARPVEDYLAADKGAALAAARDTVAAAARRLQAAEDAAAVRAALRCVADAFVQSWHAGNAPGRKRDTASHHGVTNPAQRLSGCCWP